MKQEDEQPPPPRPRHVVWQRRRCRYCGAEEPRANTRKRHVRSTRFRCDRCGRTWLVVWRE